MYSFLFNIKGRGSQAQDSGYISTYICFIFVPTSVSLSLPYLMNMPTNYEPIHAMTPTRHRHGARARAQHSIAKQKPSLTNARPSLRFNHPNMKHQSIQTDPHISKLLQKRITSTLIHPHPPTIPQDTQPLPFPTAPHLTQSVPCPSHRTASHHIRSLHMTPAALLLSLYCSNVPPPSASPSLPRPSTSLRDRSHSSSSAAIRAWYLCCWPRAR